MTYHNPNNSTHSQYSKGVNGEQIFEQWLIDNNFTYRKATEEEDYKDKVDYFVEGLGKVAVKNNYNQWYDTVVVELEQLVDGCPAAWITHDVDYVCFICEQDVILVTVKSLRSVDYNLVKQYTRYQSATKGSYVIAFLPLYILMELKINKKSNQ